jgi:hypothetical protein
VTGFDLRRNRGKMDVEGLDLDLADGLFELARQPGSIDEARSPQADIEIAEHPAAREAPRPFGRALKLAGGVAAADHRTHRGAGDDFRL